MKFELNALMLSFVAATTLSLGGCSGGDSDSDDKPTPGPVVDNGTGTPANPSTGGETPVGEPATPITVDGQPITIEATNMAQKSGVWVTRYEFYAEPLPAGSTAAGVVNTSGANVSSWQYISDNEIIVDDCQLEAPVTETLAEFNSFEAEVEEADPDAPEEPTPFDICADGMVPEIFAVSDTHYRANMLCQGQRVGALERIQISAQPGFNQGALSFTADGQENFNASAGVCGSVMHADMSVKTGWLQIVAPYGDDERVELDVLTFSELKPGDYVIGSSEGNGAHVSITSQSLSDPESLDGLLGLAREGSITIDSVDTFAVSGSFDVTSIEGEKFQGNFDLNLR